MDIFNDPVGVIRQSLIQLALDNWHLIAMAVFGVAALGTLLGSLKKLAVSMLATSIKAGERATAVVLSHKGRRIAVPLALAGTLFGSGFLLGANRPARVEYVRQPPEIVTRDVVKEVVREVKVPTFIEKIVEIPARIMQSPANAKCEYCAALLNVDGVPPAPPPGTPFADPSRKRNFRCGGCDAVLDYEEARIRFRFKRKEPLKPYDPYVGTGVDTYTAIPVGRDPIPEPSPPPADATPAMLEKHQKAVELWKQQCKRFITRE